jgi:hypothetical protein
MPAAAGDAVARSPPKAMTAVPTTLTNMRSGDFDFMNDFMDLFLPVLSDLSEAIWAW